MDDKTLSYSYSGDPTNILKRALEREAEEAIKDKTQNGKDNDEYYQRMVKYNKDYSAKLNALNFDKLNNRGGHTDENRHT